VLRQRRREHRIGYELDRARLETRQISASQSLRAGIGELGTQAGRDRHRCADLVKATAPLGRPDAPHGLRAWHWGLSNSGRPRRYR